MRLQRALVLVVTFPFAAAAQGTGPGLVVPVPSASQVTITVDSFTTPTGERRAMQLVMSKAGRSRETPVVVFANNSGPALMQTRGYQEWARLVSSRKLAGLLYEGAGFDPQKSLEMNREIAVAYLDSVIATLQRRRAALGVDPDKLVVWAGSGMTWSGTPFALSGNRRVNGYVLYYGSGAVRELRADVPVLMVRAGLDSPSLNASLDSLARRLTDLGSQVTVINHAAGTHGFDLNDSTLTTASVITQTLDFMERVTTPALHAAIMAEVSEAQAGAALASRRWDDAERAYLILARQKPNSRSAAWKLGIAQLENGHPADALISFDRAKALGQGGARDIGVPAIRAALRSGNRAKAGEWTAWALRSYPPIREEIAADAELAPALELSSGGDPFMDRE